MENTLKFKKIIDFVRSQYPNEKSIPLHRPRFTGNEIKYINEAIVSTYVSSVGPLVREFEKKLSSYTGIKYCNATVNGTSALHIALKAIGVGENIEVLTQSLTFVATVNAIKYCNAEPVFIDIDLKTLGMSATSLEKFLNINCEIRDDGKCWNNISNREIRAVLPMHTFGHPVDLEKISYLCDKYNLFLIEDGAESLGSFYKKKHTGNYGIISTLSFNGNKIITTGGGGAVLTNNKDLSIKMSHLINTAKVTHQWNFYHDEVGYNYRMPNLNAALGLAQIEQMDNYLICKRKLFDSYKVFADEIGIDIFKEPEGATSNYWLNCIITENPKERNYLIKMAYERSVLMRPAWHPIHNLPMYRKCLKGELTNTKYLFDRIVCIPSSVI